VGEKEKWFTFWKRAMKERIALASRAGRLVCDAIWKRKQKKKKRRETGQEIIHGLP
jgi:hypothetical protein